MRDIAHGEKVEGELNILITRRHDKREVEEGERAAEALYAENCRRHAERERRELDAERHEYHTGQAVRLRRTLESLVSYHEAEAEKYLSKGDAA